MSTEAFPLTEEEIYVGNRLVTPILPLACMDDPLKCSNKAKQNFLAEQNPAKLAGYEAIMDFLMLMPFGISKPIFHLISTKTSLIITSLPTTFDFSFEGDVHAEALHGITCSISATRTIAAVVQTNDQITFSFSSDITRIKEPERFRKIVQ
jgi:hypothetical protein